MVLFYFADLLDESRSSIRSKTPTPQDHLIRPRTPTSGRSPTSDHRSKTPTPGGEYRSKTPTPELQAGREPFSEMQNLRGSQRSSDYPATGGYYDGYNRQDYPGNPGRTNYRPDFHPGHGYNDQNRRDVDAGGGYQNSLDYDADKRMAGMTRSRTPGPEFMRGGAMNADDPANRSRTPTAQDMRSKTPTVDHYPFSGTPDFIPASKYQSPSNNNSGGYNRAANQNSQYRVQDVQYRNNALNQKQRPMSGPEYAPGGPQYLNDSFSSNSSSKMNTSATYGSNLNYVSGQNPPLNTDPSNPNFRNRGGSNQMSNRSQSLPRKQSTSFEHEEPAPGNLTRVPRPPESNRYSSGSPQNSLNRSRSPNPRMPHSQVPAEEDRFVELSVFLKRQESGFGFRIIGGTEEGSQVQTQVIIDFHSVSMVSSKTKALVGAVTEKKIIALRMNANS